MYSVNLYEHTIGATARPDNHVTIVTGSNDSATSARLIQFRVFTKARKMRKNESGLPPTIIELIGPSNHPPRCNEKSASQKQACMPLVYLSYTVSTKI